MAYDSVRGRVVLFGGEGGGGSLLNDTWEWDGLEWVQQEDTGPTVRSGAAVAFDATRARTVLFGGAEAGGTGAGDTWEWDGRAWTQSADFGPEPCTRAAMAFNGADTALYGGIGTLAPNANAPLFGITWDWNGKHWTARQDMGPGPRVGHALAFDVGRSRIVLFGGVSVAPSAADAAQNVKGDTWEQIRTAITPPEVVVDLAALEISPNPAPAGQGVTFTVVLVAAVPEEARVELLVDGAEVTVITVEPGEMTGSVQLQIAADVPLGDYVITARSGSSEVSATLTITN
jgi:hypothetical protein